MFAVNFHFKGFRSGVGHFLTLIFMSWKTSLIYGDIKLISFLPQDHFKCKVETTEFRTFSECFSMTKEKFEGDTKPENVQIIIWSIECRHFS